MLSLSLLDAKVAQPLALPSHLFYRQVVKRVRVLIYRKVVAAYDTRVVRVNRGLLQKQRPSVLYENSRFVDLVYLEYL